MKHARVSQRRTRIVCTLGPATSRARAIERLIRGGMDVARLNLSHGTRREHVRFVQTVRRLGHRLGANVAVLIDLPGPKYRTGKLKNGRVTLKKGGSLVLTTREVVGDATMVSVNLPTLMDDARVGATVLLDDGAMQLRVVDRQQDNVVCRVVIGGVLTEGRGLVMPGIRSAGPFMTDALREHLLFAAGQQPDFLAVSFVGTEQDIRDVRAALPDGAAEIPIIAKIERGEAVRNFDQILDASDGIMVARGDLGTDIPLERVPLVQRDIIRKCNRAGKPVITATEMLESMVSAARPTRAEVSDVANAIFDGTDATMLSAETAVGRFPVRAVRIMARIARETERRLPYDEMLAERAGWLERKTEELISYDACHTAHYLGAAAIVAFTHSGSTAGRVSKYRPRVPVLAISPDEAVCGRLLLHWGIHPLRVARLTHVSDLFATGVRLTKELGLASPGDLIVITGGIPIGVSGSTNLLKVEVVT